MKRLAAHMGPLAFGVAVVTVILVTAVLLIGGASERDSFWSQLAATLAAVLIGVPVGVWLAWSQQQAERDRREADSERERAQAADALLGVIDADLMETRAAMAADRAGGPLEQTTAPPTAGSLLDYLVFQPAND